MEREEEIELARHLLAGDSGAFDQFVEYFRAKIFHYSYMICGQREDAEEVTQETLLSVFENFHALEQPERVRPWVFRIARNACLMKRRKSVFAPATAQEISLDELMPTKDHSSGQMRIEIADWSRVPENQAMRSELKSALETAIGALPEMYKTVMLLRDVEELSTQETAQILDLSDSTVKQRLHRARLAVRKHLDRHLKGAAHGNA